MNLLKVLLVTVLLASCSQDKGTELIEESNSLEQTELSNKKTKKNVVKFDIPFGVASFSYDMKRKDRVVEVNGRLIEKLGSDPLRVNFNVKPKSKKVVVKNNTTDEMTLFLNLDAVYESNTQIITFLNTRKLYIPTGKKVVIKRKGKKYIVNLK